MAAQQSEKSPTLADKLHVMEDVFRNKLLAVAAQSSHAGSQGSEMENQWIDMFRQCLPLRYAISKGFVVDSENNVSDQIDCVVYDSFYTPKLYGGKDNLCVPVEAVYAVIESKSRLTFEEAKYACEKLESVQELCRTSAPIVDRGEQHKPRDFFKIVGGLLVVNCDAQAETIKKHLQSSCLDFILSPGKGQEDAFYVDNFDGAGKLMFRQCRGALIAGIFRFLKKLQSVGTVPAIDWDAYEKATKNE